MTNRLDETREIRLLVDTAPGLFQDHIRFLLDRLDQTQAEADRFRSLALRVKGQLVASENRLAETNQIIQNLVAKSPAEYTGLGSWCGWCFQVPTGRHHRIQHTSDCAWKRAQKHLEAPREA